jgi:hypothetical protein
MVTGVGWFLILSVRGLLLWLVVPFAFLAWLLVHRRWQKASLRQTLSWYDANLVGILVNGPFRMLIRPDLRPELVTLSAMSKIAPHRISLIDVN